MKQRSTHLFPLHLLFPVLSLVFIGLFIYWRNIFALYSSISDADSIYSGQAILFNSGLKQTYTDHTGYFYILLLSWWHKVAYFFGFLKSINILIRN